MRFDVFVWQFVGYVFVFFAFSLVLAGGALWYVFGIVLVFLVIFLHFKICDSYALPTQGLFPQYFFCIYFSRSFKPQRGSDDYKAGDVRVQSFSWGGRWSPQNESFSFEVICLRLPPRPPWGTPKLNRGHPQAPSPKVLGTRQCSASVVTAVSDIFEGKLVLAPAMKRRPAVHASDRNAMSMARMWWASAYVLQMVDAIDVGQPNFFLHFLRRQCGMGEVINWFRIQTAAEFAAFVEELDQKSSRACADHVDGMPRLHQVTWPFAWVALCEARQTLQALGKLKVEAALAAHVERSAELRDTARLLGRVSTVVASQPSSRHPPSHIRRSRNSTCVCAQGGPCGPPPEEHQIEEFGAFWHFPRGGGTDHPSHEAPRGPKSSFRHPPPEEHQIVEFGAFWAFPRGGWHRPPLPRGSSRPEAASAPPRRSIKTQSLVRFVPSSGSGWHRPPLPRGSTRLSAATGATRLAAPRGDPKGWRRA